MDSPATYRVTTTTTVTVLDDRSGQAFSHDPSDARRWANLMAFDLDGCVREGRRFASSRRLALPGAERLLPLYEAWGLCERIFTAACKLSQDAATDPDDEEEEEGDTVCCETEGASLEHLGADVVVCGNTVRIVGE
jgi:hypothetical protein